jgi:hypothetical protein
MIKVTHLGLDYSKIEVDGEEFEASLALGEAIAKMIGQCAWCGEPMHTLARAHHHTESGVDVTKRGSWNDHLFKTREVAQSAESA